MEMIGELIAIFWTINDPPGIKGLRQCKNREQNIIYIAVFFKKV